MARSTIELVFQGITRGLTGAAAQVEAAAAAAEAAERNLARSRAESEAAAGKLQRAEDALGVSRSQHEAALSRIGVAETNLEQVRARSEGSMTRLGAAEANLEQLRNRAGVSAEQIAAAEARVTQTRQEADTAAARLQAAESRLLTARANGESSASRVRAAEEALLRARRDNESALGRLGDAETRNRRAQDDLNNSSRDARGGLLALLGGIISTINPFSGLSEAIGTADTRMSAFGALLSGIGGPIGSTVVGVLQLVAVLGSVGEIVGVVGGLIGQVLGGAVPILLTLAAAAVTVALGMDGMKKAFEVMKPALDKLKADVSAVFVQQLTPAVKELAGVLPQLTGGFKGIALAISGLIANILNFVSSAAGLKEVQTILAGTEGFVRGLSLGVLNLVQGFLAVGAAAGPAMSSVGDALGSVLSKLGTVLSQLAGGGFIQKAVEGLAATFRGLGDVIAPVIEILVRMGAALGDSVGAALTQLGGIIQSTSPFFEHLAFVAGDLLKSAFEQLGPPMQQLFGGEFPAANSIMDQFASFVKNVALPAIAGFISWLSTNGLPGMALFASGCADAMLTFASTTLATVSTILGALHSLAVTFALIPGPWQQGAAQMAAATEGSQKQVDSLRGSIDLLHPKIVDAIANAFGEPKVRTLFQAVENLHDKTITITVNTQYNGSSPAAVHLAGYATGGRPPIGVPFVVGEQGPELMTLDGRGGYITNASRTHALLNSGNVSAGTSGSSWGSGDAPITVNVLLSQEHIAGIAQVEIARRDRATKRTVLAGSGVTF